MDAANQPVMAKVLDSLCEDLGQHITRGGRSDLTFAEVTRQNLSRCEKWHPGGIADWSPERWLTATGGEIGELGDVMLSFLLYNVAVARFGEVENAMKKLFRVEDGIANLNTGDRAITDYKVGAAKIGAEAADVFLYLNLAMCRLGIDLSAEVVRKFNETSEKYGFPERL